MCMQTGWLSGTSTRRTCAVGCWRTSMPGSKSWRTSWQVGWHDQMCAHECQFPSAITLSCTRYSHGVMASRREFKRLLPAALPGALRCVCVCVCVCMHACMRVHLNARCTPSPMHAQRVMHFAELQMHVALCAPLRICMHALVTAGRCASSCSSLMTTQRTPSRVARHAGARTCMVYSAYRTWLCPQERS